MVPNCKKNLGLPFGTLLDTFGPLLFSFYFHKIEKRCQVKLTKRKIPLEAAGSYQATNPHFPLVMTEVLDDAIVVELVLQVLRPLLLLLLSSRATL